MENSTALARLRTAFVPFAFLLLTPLSVNAAPRLLERVGYVGALLKDPAVASITPSSRFVVSQVTKALNLPEAKVIVEYGPARGVITERVLAQMRPDAKLFAVEYNEQLHADLTKNLRDPRLIAIRGDVRKIQEVLATHDIRGADAIFSGVPFSQFTDAERYALLEKTADLLPPQGRFVPYQVTSHLIPRLKRHFSRVETRYELRNIPPLFIFTAIK